nr:thrombospondin type 3 repeat-containing protein [Spirochaetales bacterium]
MRVTKKAIGLGMFIGSFFAALTGYGAFPGEIRVFVWDSSSGSNGGAPPPLTTATLNDLVSYSFETNNVATFSGYYEAGVQLVEVSSETTGYLLRQSSASPTGTNDLYSAYGNPRYINLSEENCVVSVGFIFDPIITTTAILRDAWTMERIENAAIEFIGKAGVNSGTVYSGYPWIADYAATWVTDGNGSFPTNTILYLDAYDLNITKEGFNPLIETNIINNAAAGDAIDLGTVFMEPIDNNGNQIADAWESTYFGTGSTVNPYMDEDGDGVSNQAEYIAGTNPTNRNSCLRVDSERSVDEFCLSWNPEPDRTYCVSGTTNLLTDTWVQV